MKGTYTTIRRDQSPGFVSSSNSAALRGMQCHEIVQAVVDVFNDVNLSCSELASCSKSRY